MKPHIILHMVSSIDGRITTGTWPENHGYGDVYERIHRDLAGDGWIVGRITMAEFAEGEPTPARADAPLPRATWIAPGAEKGPYAIALDRDGKLHLNMSRANGDALIAVLTEKVSDDHLAELRRDGISYLFAGKSDIDLGIALDILSETFGVKRLLLEGGGGINGSFLSAGLIDEISLLVVPLIDGTTGTPTSFDRQDGSAAPMRLRSVETLENDILHLRYELTSP